MREFLLQEWNDGHWATWQESDDCGILLQKLVAADKDFAKIPRRLLGPHSETIVSGRWCARDTPVNDIRPFWIVMSLDKPGPCERDGRPYSRHDNKSSAVTEARRLTAAVHGGRFGVLELIHVVGFVDFNLELEIPF